MDKMNMSFATMLINPAKQPAVPQNGFGFKALFIATSLFLISSGSASNASTEKNIVLLNGQKP
jgi:hypothetical protein